MNNSAEGVISNFDTFVLDTSVIINLHKSNYGKQIIRTLSGNFVITQNVSEELNRLNSLVYGTHDFLRQILNFDNVHIVNLNHIEKNLRDNLLDTTNKPIINYGEASVIAVSKHSFSDMNCIPIIDERKGREAAAKCLYGRECGYSLNLFFQPEVLSSLGKENASDAVYHALLDAHMSIPRNCSQHVIEFIGVERAKKCTSLPDYKKLFFNGNGENFNRKNKK